MFAKVGLASVLVIAGVAGPAIGRVMATPVDRETQARRLSNEGRDRTNKPSAAYQ